MEILQLEQLKRSLILFSSHIGLVERIAVLGRLAAALGKKYLPSAAFCNFFRDVDRVEPQMEGMKVEVTVVAGRRLPQMDLIVSLNPYCLVFLAGDRSYLRKKRDRTGCIERNSNLGEEGAGVLCTHTNALSPWRKVYG